MKNYFKILGLSLAVILTSCDPDEQEQFDNVNGSTAIAFSQTSIETSVPTAGRTITLPVTITTISSESRSFNVSVSESDDVAAFTLGSVVIPANSYEGILDITIDFDEIGGNDGEVRTALIQLTPSEGASAYNDIATVSYFREIVCNDATLTINTDSFASETGFQIIDDAGVIVYELATGSLANGVQTFTADIFLADGCYTAVITDSYSDGQVDSTTTGNYTITCSIITFATGGGAFGASQSVPFCVNQ
ncbi:hypothetical protein LY01_01981 [Nonlabens xylanidelens]|uniref:Uncharacterized protein n=1 Tax=Nonlabens xylanidelens TaxID=191564 RepID=A0A2S6IJE0_9FLAO|nr:hypothetical protein [Nonlabens xylanidelens]PPK94344.1 hypothetical protein LY01_01981 [Nonlabens xylanidelens]PQJ18879.1 hypothetical protein BST94_07635 [Nonlabens xylanidelens]